LFTKENNAPFKLCTVCAGIAAAWTIAAPLIVSVGCSASHALETEPSSRCPSDVRSAPVWTELLANCCNS
jgi:hypothetical protein